MIIRIGSTTTIAIKMGCLQEENHSATAEIQRGKATGFGWEVRSRLQGSLARNDW